MSKLQREGQQKYSLAWVTGGSSGIGLAIARKLARMGSNVLLIARNADKLEIARNSVAEHCSSQSQRIEILPCDVADTEKVKNLLSNALSTLGVPDLVVSCAGIAYPNYFELIPDERFRATIDTNLIGTWNVLQSVVSDMKRRGGTIVTTSSIAGFVGVFGYAAYGASKYAIYGLSEVLRAELKPHGISVHVLCPPDTDTPQLAEENKTKPAETRAISGHAKLFTPDAVAEALFKGLKRDVFLIIPGLNGKLINIINRLFPRLVHSLMDGDIKKAGRLVHEECTIGY